MRSYEVLSAWEFPGTRCERTYHTVAGPRVQALEPPLDIAESWYDITLMRSCLPLFVAQPRTSVSLSESHMDTQFLIDVGKLWGFPALLCILLVVLSEWRARFMIKIIERRTDAEIARVVEERKYLRDRLLPPGDAPLTTRGPDA